MIHIGHVVENSLGWDRDIWSIPGRELESFGERVREWAQAVSPVANVSPNAAYYGGWPSANLPTIGWDGVVSTALLLEDQVIGKDPISDWFCWERYNRPNLLASRSGWQPEGPGSSPDVAATRRFLAMQLPAIRALTPLLDAGLVVLVPSEIIQDENRRRIANLSHAVSEVMLNDAPYLARQFQPNELAVDDDVRGFFALAGGQVERQTRKHLQRAIDYFAAEYILSQATQSIYTSVFDWESFVLRQGVSKALSPLTPTTQVMLSSEIPAFTGLTPQILRSIHDDDAFGEFRAELENIYGNCPLGTESEVEAYSKDREKTLLEPILHRVNKELDRGPLSRLGIGASRVSFSLAAGLVATGIGTATTGPGGAALGLIPVVGGLFDAARRGPQGTTKIWSSLVKHGRTVRDEVPRAIAHAGDLKTQPSTNPWGIASEPGNSLRITQGTILHWHVTRPEDSVSGGDYQKGIYAPCSCGSALKYRFCCAGVTPAP